MNQYCQRQFELFETIENSFKNSQKPSEVVELMEDYSHDSRLCLTAVSFLPTKLTAIIEKNIIEPLRRNDSAQYFFPPASLHLTIKNIRIISDPPQFSDQDIAKTERIFSEIISQFRKITFELRGLFTLPTSLAVRAYCNETLKELILALDTGLNAAGVPDNKKYASSEIFFGNITVCRYTSEPRKNFLNTVVALKNISVGELVVKKISLITTNAVCHPQKTKIINEFLLK